MQQHKTDATKKPYQAPTLVCHGDVRDITKMAKLFGVADMGAQQFTGGAPGGS